MGIYYILFCFTDQINPYTKDGLQFINGLHTLIALIVGSLLGI